MIYQNESPPFRLEKDDQYSEMFQVKGYEKDMAVLQRAVIITVGYDSDETTVPKIRHYQNVNGTSHFN